MGSTTRVLLWAGSETTISIPSVCPHSAHYHWLKLDVCEVVILRTVSSCNLMCAWQKEELIQPLQIRSKSIFIHTVDVSVCIFIHTKNIYCDRIISQIL